MATYFDKPTGNGASSRGGNPCGSCALRGEVFCRTLDKAGSLATLRNKTVTYSRDSSLFEEGAKPGFIGVLKRGYLRGEHVNSDGRRMILWLIRPGNLVGSLPGLSTSYALEAATDAEICHFNEAGLAAMMAQSPRFRHQILRGILELRNKQLDLLWLRSALSSQERLIAFLVIMTGIMPTDPMPDGSLIVTIDLSRRDWADMSNTSVETISRTMTRLAQTGLVETLPQNRYRIHDLTALAETVGMKADPKRALSSQPRPGAAGPAPLARGGTRVLNKTTRGIGPERVKPVRPATPLPMR